MYFQELVGKLVEASPAYQADPAGMAQLWSRVRDRMYSLATREQQMGLGEQVCELAKLQCHNFEEKNIEFKLKLCSYHKLKGVEQEIVKNNSHYK